MRKPDLSRQRGILNDNRRDVEELLKRDVAKHLAASGLVMGTGIVQESHAWGEGSIVDVAVMSNGLADSIILEECVCHDGLLSIGAAVTWLMRAGGEIEVVAGGSGSGGTTTVNIAEVTTGWLD